MMTPLILTAVVLLSPGRTVEPPHRHGPGQVSAAVTCVVDLPAGRAGCAGSSAAAESTPADGTFAIEVALVEAAYHPDEARFRARLAIVNGAAEPLGTSDGRTPVGFRVFVTESTHPLVTADGRRALDGGDHPYVHYPEIVAPGDTSSARAWEWDVPPGESRFSFTVRVQARFPGDVEIPAEPPDWWIIPEDRVEALFSRENTIFVHPRMSGPYLRNVVTVRFHALALLEERQAAIDLVDGVVVGGDRLYYLVQIPDRTGDPWWAVDLLEGLDQVAAVHPLMFGIGPAGANADPRPTRPDADAGHPVRRRPGTASAGYHDAGERFRAPPRPRRVQAGRW